MSTRPGRTNAPPRSSTSAPGGGSDVIRPPDTANDDTHGRAESSVYTRALVTTRSGMTLRRVELGWVHGRAQQAAMRAEREVRRVLTGRVQSEEDPVGTQV